ncbi:MAG: EAL domain-containing protein [Rhodospirillaceae bacterium]|nr:EAL domain-containing protein [Rhodospirillaceae bacterium]
MRKPNYRTVATDHNATIGGTVAAAGGTVMEAPEPVFRIDAEGAVRYANAAASELLRMLSSGLGSDLPADWVASIRELSPNVAGCAEISAGERVFDIHASPQTDNGWVTVHAHDVTHHKVAALDAQRLAHLDALTGLPTRSVFQDQLGQVLAVARRSKRMAAVLVIGLDDFKFINETQGHASGDNLLQTTAERLSRCLRATDIVARLGGDEFAIIQPEPTGADGIDQLARRLNAALRAPVSTENGEILPAASIGIAVFPDDAEDADKLLHHADIALDRCKAAGGDDHRFFIAEMNAEVQRKHALEHDLRLAIDRETLEVHYQPKLDLATGRITGMEALVRWIDPVHGFVSPAEFIPIAETSRLIIPLGDWVLREACRRTKEWNDAGLGPLKVAVNLSAVQFGNATLLNDLSAALAETGLAPELLELEITETAAMDNAAQASEVFAGISELGISLAIDDFGTGYSSLSYLKNFPVQRIKIDKAFVDDIGQTAKGGAIARAITTLGESFDMAVTAEGVETAEQMAFLHGIECQEVQGYFVSKPLPVDAFSAFMRDFDPSPFRPALDQSGFDWRVQQKNWRRGLLGDLKAFA